MSHKFTATVTVEVRDGAGNIIGTRTGTADVSQHDDAGDAPEKVAQYVSEEMDGMLAAATHGLENCYSMK